MTSMGKSGGSAKIFTVGLVPCLIQFLYQILYLLGDLAADFVDTNIFASPRSGFYLRKLTGYCGVGAIFKKTWISKYKLQVTRSYIGRMDNVLKRGVLP